MNGFSRRAPRQWIRRLLQKYQNLHRWCPEVTCITGNAHSVNNDVEGLPYAVKMLLQPPMDSRAGSIVALVPKIHIFSIACWASAVRFSGRLLITGLATVANARF